MRTERVVITGYGLVTAIGSSAEEIWKSLDNGVSGIGPLTQFTSPRCGHFPVAEVKGDLAAETGIRLASRCDHMAVIASRSATAMAGFSAMTEEAQRMTAVVLGASTGGMADSEIYLAKLMQEKEMDTALTRRHECAWSCEAVADDLELVGQRMTICTACASGGTAISTACDLIRSGEADMVIAGGVDSLTQLTLNGFASLMVVSEDGCRPFDAQRQGMTLGEGAAVFVLESESHARERNANILGVVAGVGSTCDAYHVTAPSPDGSGMRKAMQRALRQAGLQPTDIDYINAHGTGTQENDPAEAEAIRGVFGEQVPPVSSTKRYFGHTLSAAGAIEAVLCLMAIQRGRIPRNLGLRTVDERIGFEPVRECIDKSIRAAMSNSLGFGGTNCSVIVRDYEPGGSS